MKKLAVAACLFGLFFAAPSFAISRNAAVNSSTTIGAASAQVVAADSLRGMLIIYNGNVSATFWCNMAGGTAAANAAGNLYFGTTGALILDASVPTNAINCIGSTTGVIVTVITITNVSN